MKIKILKTCRFAFEPWIGVISFNKDVVYDVSDERASRLIATGYAVEFGRPVEEKAQPQDENKAIDLTKVENKTLNNKKRGRPPKVR